MFSGLWSHRFYLRVAKKPKEPTVLTTKIWWLNLGRCDFSDLKTERHVCFARIQSLLLTRLLIHQKIQKEKRRPITTQSVINYFYMRAAGKTKTTVTVNLPPPIMSSYVCKNNWWDMQIQARMLQLWKVLGENCHFFFLRLQSNIFLQCWTCFLKIRNKKVTRRKNLLLPQHGGYKELHSFNHSLYTLHSN